MEETRTSFAQSEVLEMSLPVHTLFHYHAVDIVRVGPLRLVPRDALEIHQLQVVDYRLANFELPLLCVLRQSQTKGLVLQERRL